MCWFILVSLSYSEVLFLKSIRTFICTLYFIVSRRHYKLISLTLWCKAIVEAYSFESFTVRNNWAFAALWFKFGLWINHLHFSKVKRVPLTDFQNARPDQDSGCWLAKTCKDLPFLETSLELFSVFQVISCSFSRFSFLSGEIHFSFNMFQYITPFMYCMQKSSHILWRSQLQTSLWECCSYHTTSFYNQDQLN